MKAAYLNADLEEEIYTEAPEGNDNYKKKYWKLNKALYGLKQTGRAWNNTFNEVMTEFNFIRLESEPCVYVKKNRKGNVTCLLAIYVDDILITGVKDEILKARKCIKSKLILLM